MIVDEAQSKSLGQGPAGSWVLFPIARQLEPQGGPPSQAQTSGKWEPTVVEVPPRR